MWITGRTSELLNLAHAERITLHRRMDGQVALTAHFTSGRDEVIGLCESDAAAHETLIRMRIDLNRPLQRVR